MSAVRKIVVAAIAYPLPVAATALALMKLSGGDAAFFWLACLGMACLLAVSWVIGGAINSVIHHSVGHLQGVEKDRLAACVLDDLMKLRYPSSEAYLEAHLVEGYFRDITHFKDEGHVFVDDRMPLMSIDCEVRLNAAGHLAALAAARQSGQIRFRKLCKAYLEAMEKYREMLVGGDPGPCRPTGYRPR